MSARAISDLKNSLIKSYIVKSGTTTVVGKRVKFDTTDQSIDNAGAADELAIGTALEAITGDGAKKIQVVLDCAQIVPMIVGTGGATRGTLQVAAADGVTDIAAAGVTNEKPVVGRAMQSGVQGDLIGVGVGGPGRATTA